MAIYLSRNGVNVRLSSKLSPYFILGKCVNNFVELLISLAAQTKFEEMLIESLEEAEAVQNISLQKAGLKINQAAELLMLAANGLKTPAPSADIFRIRLKNLIRLFVEAVKSESK